MKGLQIAFIWLAMTSLGLASGNAAAPMLHANVNLKDKASLQRGAKLYMNYCSGCHSLKYLRYNRMAKDIGITDENGQVDETLLKENLNFTGTNVGDGITIALPADDGREWFGIAPPDLSLSARQRGSNWLFTYLMSFYNDEKRLWGSNNWLFPDVAMPNVLYNLQGKIVPIKRTESVPYNGSTKDIEVISHLQQTEIGDMTEHQFEIAIHDIVNFLTYTGEPA